MALNKNYYYHIKITIDEAFLGLYPAVRPTVLVLTTIVQMLPFVSPSVNESRIVMPLVLASFLLARSDMFVDRERYLEVDALTSPVLSIRRLVGT